MITVEIADWDPTRIRISAEFRWKEVIKTIPGATWNRDHNTWAAPLSWSTCLAVRAVFKDLTIGPLLNEWAREFVETKVKPGLALRDATEAELPGDEDLFPYQQADVLFLSKLRRAMLFSDMGTGKTASAIRSMRRLARDGETPWPALVVAPNSTKLEWKRQFERWWPGIKVSVVKGTALQRRKAMKTPAHVYVINYEALRSHSRVAPYGSHALRRCAECGGEDDSVTVGSCQVHIRELNEIDFQLVIADEAHRIKDASSITARALKAATGKAPFRFAMTGTPIAHNVMDEWSILNWLEPEEFPSKTRFMDRMVNVMYNVFGGLVISGLKPEFEEEFHKAIDFRMRRMTKDVVLKFLPPVVPERRDVEMTPKQQKAYNDVSKTMMTELADGTMITAGTGLIKAIRLLQLASSYGTVELKEKPDGKVSESLILEDPSSKINAFMEDLPDFGPEQVVVFAVSRQLIELLSARMTAEGIAHGLVTGKIDEDERQRHIDAFQDGKTQFILCTIAAGGTGITLTAASTRVFLQRSWSSIEMAQAKDRTRRIGSERHKVISHIDYVTPGTLEEAVIAVLDGKLDSMEDILRDRELFAKAVAGKVVW